MSSVGVIRPCSKIYASLAARLRLSNMCMYNDLLANRVLPTIRGETGIFRNSKFFLVRFLAGCSLCGARPKVSADMDDWVIVMVVLLHWIDKSPKRGKRSK